MKLISLCRELVSSLALLLCVVSTPALAQQISSDGSLATPTAINTVGLNSTISGGDRIGNNLFHSFSEFSVFANESAIFANPADVTNILGRITGGNLSTINGEIRASGTANLFLINPAGIVFGPDAQLKIGGSFVGSTAESIRFSGDIEFSATMPAPPSLLMVSAPVGLQLGASSQDIRVQDTGYTTLAPIPVTVSSPSSLAVNPGKTLALIGSNVRLEGGTLAAPAGHIELGGVRTGVVNLNLSATAFDYTDVSQFGDVELASQSLVTASGIPTGVDVFFLPTADPFAFTSQGGSVHIRSEQLSVQDDSKVVIQNLGNLSFGSIRVEVNDTIKLTENGTATTGLFTTNFGGATGGNVEISARQLLLFGDADISTDTFRNGVSGNIAITVTDIIDLTPSSGTQPGFGNIETASYGPGTAGNVNIGTAERPTRRLAIAGDGITSTNESAGIVSQTVGSGSGGNVQVFAGSIRLSNGGSISAATLGQGPGGDVTVVSDAIEVIGVAPLAALPSIIAAATTSTGDAGNVDITTRTLLVQNGGRIDSSTLAFGAAGSVTITASEQVNVRGTVPGSINPSLIISSANIVDPNLRAFFAAINSPLPVVPTGASGDVTINTPSLVVAEGAQVTAKNDGTGNAGTLTLNAGNVFVNSGASITASTAQGSGGNITLNLRDILLLRQGSRLSAEAGGAGDGGNIVLNAPVLLALENSDIIANAVQGDGGNIQINTQGILGTAPRQSLTSESDITASSQFGVSGVTEITNVQVDPGSGIVALPEAIADSSNQVVAGCTSAPSNQFIASGRGGLPLNPTQQTTTNRPWQDIRDIRNPINGSHDQSAVEIFANSVAHSQTSASETQLTEATDWTLNKQGQIALVATVSNQSDINNTACLSTLTDLPS